MHAIPVIGLLGFRGQDDGITKTGYTASRRTGLNERRAGHLAFADSLGISQGLKKPFTFASKDAMHKTVMPKMYVSGVMSPSAPSPPRTSICTAGERTACCNGQLPFKCSMHI